MKEHSIIVDVYVINIRFIDKTEMDTTRSQSTLPLWLNRMDRAASPCVQSPEAFKSVFSSIRYGFTGVVLSPL